MLKELIRELITHLTQPLDNVTLVQFTICPRTQFVFNIRFHYRRGDCTGFSSDWPLEIIEEMKTNYIFPVHISTLEEHPL